MIINIVPANAASDRCLKYKITPRVDFEEPEFKKIVEQKLFEEDSLQGHVEAALSMKFGVGGNGQFVKDGFCVWLDNLTATIGYGTFTVRIDERFKKDGCEYNAVMKHEDKHIKAYKSVFKKYKKELYDAIYNAANLAMPVFVTKKSEMNTVLEKFNKDITENPEYMLVIKKIENEAQLQNQKIDKNEDNSEMQKCIDKNWS